MRGFKAKVLRRIALSVKTDEPGYIYPKGRTHKKVGMSPTGQPFFYKVTGMAIHRSEAHRLYKSMKRDMSIGGQ